MGDKHFFTWRVQLAIICMICIALCLQIEISPWYWPSLVFLVMVLYLKFAPLSWFETLHRSEEIIYIYPTVGFETGDGDVCVRIHGSVCHPKKQDRLRGAVIRLIASLVKVDGRPEEEKERFVDRLSCFLVDNRRGKRIAIRLLLPDGSVHHHTFGKLTSSGGHVFEDIIIPRAQCLDSSGQLANWVSVKSVAQDEQENEFEGGCQITSSRGLSVVSDIDDTIKDTKVADPKLCIESSFFKPFAPVPGMPELYNRWEEEFNANFHYVSSCPYQLWRFLEEFLADEEFPKGSCTLRKVRLKDSSILHLLRSPHNHKLVTIEEFLLLFPKRSFIFVGDSGEYDPEIYVELACRYHHQVKAILIRIAPEPKKKKIFKMPQKLLSFDRAGRKPFSPNLSPLSFSANGGERSEGTREGEKGRRDNLLLRPSPLVFSSDRKISVEELLLAQATDESDSSSFFSEEGERGELGRRGRGGRGGRERGFFGRGERRENQGGGERFGREKERDVGCEEEEEMEEEDGNVQSSSPSSPLSHSSPSQDETISHDEEVDDPSPPSLAFSPSLSLSSSLSASSPPPNSPLSSSSLSPPKTRDITEAMINYPLSPPEGESIVNRPLLGSMQRERWRELKDKLPPHITFKVFEDPEEIWSLDFSSFSQGICEEEEENFSSRKK